MSWSGRERPQLSPAGRRRWTTSESRRESRRRALSCANPLAATSKRPRQSDEMRGYLRLLKRAVRSVLHKDPLEILAYYGYGNSVRAHVHGRVLEVRNVSVST